MPPRTVDNLGTDVSERYAKDQRLTDNTYIKGAGGIPSRTEIDVSTPFFPGELDLLLQAQPTHITWSSFPPPPAYHEQRKRLFTFQITPTIGPEGKWESQAQKALEKLHSIPDESLEPPQTQPKKILTALLTAINDLNKSIIDINCKRSQYHKG